MFVKVRSAFDYDSDSVSLETGLDTGSEAVVQQQFKEECDINTIVRRFGVTGELPQTLDLPQSGDFTAVKDFHSAMNLILDSEREFMRLPGEIRELFGHSPGRLIEFLEDPANREEAVKLGLVNAPREVARDGSEVPKV